jgi:WD40 repeat protein
MRRAWAAAWLVAWVGLLPAACQAEAAPKARVKFEWRQRGLHSLAFSPDGKLLAALGEETVRVWDLATGQEKANLTGEFLGHFQSITFSPNGRTLVYREAGVPVTGRGPWGKILIWDVGRSRLIRELTDLFPVGDLTLSPDGKMLAWADTVGGPSKPGVSLYELATGRKRRILTRDERAPGPEILAFSPDGRFLAFSERAARRLDGGSVGVWDLKTGKVERTIRTGWVRSMTFGGRGKLLACGNGNGTVQVLDVTSGERKATLRGTKNSAGVAVAFVGRGKRLVAVNTDQRVTVWDTQTGKEVNRRTGLAKVVKRRSASGARMRKWFGRILAAPPMALSDDGRLVALGSRDGTVRVLDVPTGNPPAKGREGRSVAR